MTAELIQELRKLNKLLFLTSTKDLSQVEKISFLAKAGFGQKEIAELIGTSSNYVNVALNRMKKAAKKKTS